MKKKAKAFLQQLLNTPSPSGFEQPAAQLFRDYLEPHVDEIDHDVHGNSYATVGSENVFTIMLAGHIDEIGLMVTQINKDGFLYINPIGGMELSLLIGQRVKILTRSGQQILGVIGRQAVHLLTHEERGKQIKIDDLWIDVGISSKEEVEKLIEIGDPVVVDVDFQQIGNENMIVARGCDDKAGAFIVAEVMRRLSTVDLNVKVVGVATVQEEVGLRGATTATYNVWPDAGIAIDVHFAYDHPNANGRKAGTVKLGGGPIMTIGANINPIMNEELIALAKKSDIPHQIIAQPGTTGTDARVMQVTREGVATSLISIPNRYMHSPVEMISLKDVDNIIKLIVKYIKKLPVDPDFRPGN